MTRQLFLLATAAAAAAVANGFTCAPHYSPLSFRNKAFRLRPLPPPLRMTSEPSDSTSRQDPPPPAAPSSDTPPSRRSFLHQTLLASIPSALLSTGVLPTPAASAVERAVGAYEQNCRDEGNCLERGDWDGAVGWNWGGRDRCDATDPRCGIDGQLKDAPPSGEDVPKTKGLVVTNVVELELAIGRGETGTLRIGLYGQDCPKSVTELIQFCTSERLGGLATTSKLLLEEGYGAFSVPVALGRGGALNVLYPGQRLDFGVPSQGSAYARAKGLNKAGEGFVPQPRPSSGDVDAIGAEPFVRSHDAAGLVSIPKSGLGYGGSGYESEDEAYGSAFQVTCGAVPGMDREGRRVVGQLMDAESMAVLARLSSLPTRKGLKGVIPGQNSGPPLLRVTVSDVSSFELEIQQPSAVAVTE